MYDSRERPALGGDRAYMEVRREQAKISDYCGFESRLLRNRSDASTPSSWHGATRADECHKSSLLHAGGSIPREGATKFLESMETIAYIIIAAIILVMCWTVWAVIKEGRPELPKKEDEK